MNSAGLKYINHINSAYSKLDPKLKRFFTESEIIERAMRCGVEVRMYEPIMDEKKYQMSDEFRQIVEATLKESVINQQQKTCNTKN